MVFLSASVLGPVLGGLLTDHLHWSFIFWINLPLGAVALVMTARALRQLPRHDRPHTLDIPGMTVMVAASVALLLALDWGGTHYPWVSWQVLVLFAGSAVLWALFASASVDGPRALHSAGDPARPGNKRDYLRRLLRHRHDHRRDHLLSALLPVVLGVSASLSEFR